MSLARRGEGAALSEDASRGAAAAAGPGAASRFFCGLDHAALVEEAERQFEAQLAEEEEAYSRHEACVELGQRCPDEDGEPCWYCEDEASEGDCCCDWEDDCEQPEEEERSQNTSPATFCGFRKSFLCKAPASVPPACSSQDGPLLDIPLPRKQQLTAEEAERNAEELVAEEERVKRKAEKKRMKKKRQKDRKRQEKQDQQSREKGQAQAMRMQDTSLQKGDGHDREPPPALPAALRSGPPDSEGSSTQDLEESLTSPGRSSSRSTEEESEEELDLTSTFVSKARLKAGSKPLLLLPKREKAARPEKKELEGKVQQEVSRSGLQMTPVEQSMVLADCGNETAKQGCYQEAVLLFTEAIKLNPQDYRLFGNRSFCYEKLQCYPEALSDAQLALSLHPGWPKGLFRFGKALVGLKRYAEAARTFEGLLQFDGFRGDAAIQLEKCRVQLRLKNGFSNCHQEWNILARGPQLPLSGGWQARGGSTQAGGHLAFINIPSAQGEVSSLPAAQVPARERFAVWVGNLTPKITQAVLLHCFEPFGPIDSIRLLPRRFCAFINYVHQEAAEAAYAALQGAEVEGSKLVLQLKHPVHATPAPNKEPAAHGQPPLKWEAIQPPSGILGSSWLHHLGH